MKQYEANFRAILVNDRAIPQLAANGSLDAVGTALGAGIAWRPPAGTHPETAEVGIAAAAIRTATSHADEVKRIQDDVRLSDIAKATDISKISQRALEAHIVHERSAEKSAAEFQVHWDAMFGARPIAPNDVVTTAIDGEIRSAVRAMDQKALTAFADRLMRGEEPGAISALKRSPLALPPVLAAVLPKAWRDHLHRIDPSAVEGLEHRAERQAWLKLIVTQTFNALPQPVKKQTGPIDDAAHAAAVGIGERASGRA